MASWASLAIAASIEGGLASTKYTFLNGCMGLKKRVKTRTIHDRCVCFTSLLFVLLNVAKKKNDRQFKLLVKHAIYLRCLQYTTFNITCATHPSHSLITSCASALASTLRIPPPILLASALAAKTASPPKLVLGVFFSSLPPPAVLFREASFVSAA